MVYHAQVIRESPLRTLLTASAALLALCVADAAEAGKRRAVRDGDTVVAYSRHGNGKVTGTVRNTRLGPQVQLPNGHWEYCRRSCSETLRVESIDFSINNQDSLFVGGGGLANECGIFGCLDISRSWD